MTVTQLPKDVCLRLGSGQVVVTLTSVAKELLENALDAGAKTVEIRLREYGANLIEVIDDGNGIPEEYHVMLCRRHTTSKLHCLDDLESIQTFGFRGEALSSLASTAGSLSITTRTDTDDSGSQLEYDRCGELSKKEQVARSVGTTVTIKEIFHDMPVRRKELIRNVRREYGKLLVAIQAIALISKGTRVIVKASGTPANLKRSLNTAFATQGGSLRDNYVSLFGHGFMASSLEEVDLNLHPCGVKVSGLISRAAPGCGRSTGDRQYLYVNGRPVEMLRIVKCINEIYRQFNSLQAAIFMLDFELSPNLYDINVSPDKRKILFHDESKMIDALREELQKHYDVNYRAISPLEILDGKNIPLKVKGLTNVINEPDYRATAADDDSDDESTPLRECLIDTTTNSEAAQHASAKNTVSLSTFDAFARNPKRPKTFSGPTVFNGFKGLETDDHFPNFPKPTPPLERYQVSGTKVKKKIVTEQRHIKMNNLQTFFVPDFVEPKQLPYSSKETSNKTLLNEIENVLESGYTDAEIVMNEDTKMKSSIDEQEIQTPSQNENDSDHKYFNNAISDEMNTVRETATADDVLITDQDDAAPDSNTKCEEISSQRAHHSDLFEVDREIDCETTKTFVNSDSDLVLGDDEKQRENTYNVEVSEIMAKMRRLNRIKRSDKTKNFVSNFKAASLSLNNHSIENHTDFSSNRNIVTAEMELESKFKKADFAQMRIVGQFNLGFIICCLQDNVFIIDQHAADEKANYERLEATTVLKKQPLIVAAPLDISASDEILLLENRELFRKNGFDFCEDQNGPVGRRILLKAVPFNKGIVFGPEDVRELLGQIQGLCESHVNARAVVPRPTRVRNMLASRACRYSIMIGRYLDRKQMRQVVSKLATLRSPWNCPHGRPTMRHLLSLSSLTDTSKARAIVM